MSKLAPLDLAFLLMENPSRQMHMAAFQLFKLPGRQKNTYLPKLLDAYRNSEVAKPFNQKLSWLDKGVASWDTVEPDLKYHVRHIAVPAPGGMEEFYEVVSFLNTTLLDRNRPLWECYIIEGLEDGQFAVLIKVHHALIDGMGAMKLFQQSLSTTASDKAIRPAWMPFASKKAKRRSRGGQSQVRKLLSQMGSVPSNLVNAGSNLLELGSSSLKRGAQRAPLPFGASRTLFNNTATSSERRYANCEIPLPWAKTMATASGVTVNDVIMTVIDDALHRYLKERDAITSKALVAIMPMSSRVKGQESSGNQVSVELVAMGEPDASIAERLQQIHEATTHIKERASKLPVAVRQLYTLFIAGSTTLPDVSAAMKSLPIGNLVISNMVGPKEQLYLAGAPLVAFHGLPIVPPGGGLNVTFATVSNSICLGVGAAPEAVDNPYHLIQLILSAVDRLDKTMTQRQSQARSTSRGP